MQQKLLMAIALLCAVAQGAWAEVVSSVDYVNTLYYPNAAMTIGAFRAYFQLTGIKATDPTSPSPAGVRAIVLNFGDGETSAIQTISKESASERVLTGWYTLDGRRLSGKPTTKGIFLNNGEKVIIPQ